MDSVSDFESGGCGFESRRSCGPTAHPRRPKFALCVLRPGVTDHAQIDLLIGTGNETVKFSVTGGSAKVHITGYEVLEETYDGFGDDDDSDDDEDDDEFGEVPGGDDDDSDDDDDDDEDMGGGGQPSFFNSAARPTTTTATTTRARDEAPPPPPPPPKSSEKKRKGSGLWLGQEEEKGQEGQEGRCRPLLYAPAPPTSVVGLVPRVGRRRRRPAYIFGISSAAPRSFSLIKPQALRVDGVDRVTRENPPTRVLRALASFSATREESRARGRRRDSTRKFWGR